MLMKYVRGSWPTNLAAQILLGAAGLAVITFLCFRLGFSLAATAFAYMTLVTLLSLIGNFVGAVILSITAVACLNYFFVPPLFSLLIDYPEDIIAIVAFLTSSLLVTALIAQLRATAEDAEASRRALVETIPALTWTALPDGSRDFHNRRWAEFSGLSSKEAEGHGWMAFFHPDDRPKVVERWNDAVKTGKPFEIEARGRTAAGEYRVLLVRAEPLRNNKGEIVKWYGVTSDIDDLRRHFRLVVEAAPNAMVMIDSAGMIVLVNTQAERAFGYSRTELLGQPVELLLPERFRRHHPQLRETFFADPQPRPMGAGRHLFGRKKDGGEFPVEIGLNPIETDEGTMVLSAIVDITARKAAELALRESEQRYGLLVDGITDYAICLLDPNGIVTNWNRGAQRIKGYRTEEIVGQHFSCFYTEQDRTAQVPQRSLEIADREGRYETEAWRVRKDGSRFLADVVMDALKDDDGRLIGFAKITRDVTERVKAARELEEARIRLVQSRAEEALQSRTGRTRARRAPNKPGRTDRLDCARSEPAARRAGSERRCVFELVGQSTS